MKYFVNLDEICKNARVWFLEIRVNVQVMFRYAIFH